MLQKAVKKGGEPENLPDLFEDLLEDMVGSELGVGLERRLLVLMPLAVSGNLLNTIIVGGPTMVQRRGFATDFQLLTEWSRLVTTIDAESEMEFLEACEVAGIADPRSISDDDLIKLVEGRVRLSDVGSQSEGTSYYMASEFHDRCRAKLSEGLFLSKMTTDNFFSRNDDLMPERDRLARIALGLEPWGAIRTFEETNLSAAVGRKVGASNLPHMHDILMRTYHLHLYPPPRPGLIAPGIEVLDRGRGAFLPYVPDDDEDQDEADPWDMD